MTAVYDKIYCAKPSKHVDFPVLELVLVCCKEVRRQRQHLLIDYLYFERTGERLRPCCLWDGDDGELWRLYSNLLIFISIVDQELKSVVEFTAKIASESLR